MARKKSTESIDSEISKIKSDMARLQDRYDMKCYTNVVTVVANKI